MTKQRQAILQCVNASDKHLCAEEIFDMVRKRLPSVAIGTVYRNLGLLVESGEVRRIIIPGEPDKYDRNLTPHSHLHCVRCQKLTDIPPLLSREEAEKKLGQPILTIRTIIDYICPECRKGET